MLPDKITLYVTKCKTCIATKGSFNNIPKLECCSNPVTVTRQLTFNTKEDYKAVIVHDCIECNETRISLHTNIYKGMHIVCDKCNGSLWDSLFFPLQKYYTRYKDSEDFELRGSAEFNGYNPLTTKLPKII